MTTIHLTSGQPPDRVATPASSRPAPSVQAVTAARADRVAALKAQIAAGTYDIPASSVADAILSTVSGSGRAAYEAAGAAARYRF